MSPHRERWWHRLDDRRIQCDLCPRDCRLHHGRRGMCFVRQRVGDAMVLATYVQVGKRIASVRAHRRGRPACRGRTDAPDRHQMRDRVGWVVRRS
jgi:hypothetical protein